MITNPTIDKSAMALSVQVGSLHENIPGLAHFLEHMLFMGTEAFPDENDFMQFLSQHNGSSNAYTCEEITNYFFDCDPKYFKKAALKFSHFFKTPLFNESSIEREINAVDSEFKMAKNNDGWRIQRMMNLFSVFEEFTIGNDETLRIKGIRDSVINFYKKTYFSSKMVLVCFHNNENIKDFIINEFENIKNSDEKIDKDNLKDELKNNKNILEYFNPNEKNIKYDVNLFKESLFKPEYVNKVNYVQSLQDTKNLVIYIEIPKEYLIFENNNIGFLKYILEKEDEFSLVEKLKKNNLSYEISVEIESTIKYSVLKIKVMLMKEGFNNYHLVLKIIRNHLFDLHLSKSDFYKLKDAEALNFKYKEKVNSYDYVSDLAREMHFYPIENILDHDYLYKDFNQQEIDILINVIKKTENWLIIITNKNIEGSLENENVSCNNLVESLNEKIVKNEKYFDINYFSVNKPSIWDNRYSKNIIKDDYRYLFIYNNDFKIPKSCISVLLNTKINKEETINCLFYLELVKESFNTKYSDSMHLNLCEYEARMIDLGIEIVVHGLNDKIEYFLNRFIEELNNVSLDKFELVKMMLKDSFVKQKQAAPYRRIVAFFKENLIPESLSLDDCILKIDNIEKENIKFIKSCYIEIFYCGNGEFLNIKNLVNNIKQKIKSSEKYRFEEIKYSQGSFNSEDKENNGVGVFYKICSEKEYKKIASVEVFMQGSSEAFFDQLRTKEALGYVTQNYLLSFNGYRYMCFLVQSEKNCDYLEERINKYIKAYISEFNSITKDEFETFKESAINAQEEEHKNIYEFFMFNKHLFYIECSEIDYKDCIKRELIALKQEKFMLEENNIKIHAFKKLIN
ncbi:hypothetical protein GVAV_000172 [Gurleya vavrai]